MNANIPFSKRTQDRIDESVQDNIGVGVADKPAIMETLTPPSIT